MGNWQLGQSDLKLCFMFSSDRGVRRTSLKVVNISNVAGHSRHRQSRESAETGESDEDIASLQGELSSSLAHCSLFFAACASL